MALIGLSLAASAVAQSPAASVVPLTADPAHPAHIHDGRCPEPGGINQNLNDVVLASDQAVGQATGVPAEVSETKVPVALTDILKGQFSINVHQSADAMDVYIACGDIGGTMLGTTDLAISLLEQNDSGYRGAALLHDNGDGSTQVTILLLVDSSMPVLPGPSAAPASSPTVPTASTAPMASMAPLSSTMPGASPATPTVSSAPVMTMAPASLTPIASPGASTTP